MMSVSVSNKHNIPHGKCFVRYFRERCFYIRNLTLSISGGMSTTRTKTPYARTFHEVFYMYNLCSRRMEVV